MGDRGRPAAPQRHSVWGRVTDPGGADVPAEVFWVHAEHAGKETVGIFDVHKVAHADNDGRFWAPDLPAGPCILVPDFQRLHVAGDQVRIAHGTAVTVPTSESEIALRFPRRRVEYGAIHGVVRDLIDKRPGARLRVAVIDESGKVVRETETGTDGRFAFTFLLSPAKYKVLLAGSRRNIGGEIPADLGSNKRIDLTIEQHRHPAGARGSVRVAVNNWLGLPLVGARIETTVPYVSVAPVTTDEHGVAEIGDLPARAHAVLAKAPGHWPSGAVVPDGDVADPAEVVVTLERGARLRVRVVDDATDRPLRHANVLVHHEGGDHWIWGGVLPPPNDPPRDFHDLDVRSGPVTVRAESPGYLRADETLDSAEMQDDVAPITLRLHRRP